MLFNTLIIFFWCVQILPLLPMLLMVIFFFACYEDSCIAYVWRNLYCFRLGLIQYIFLLNFSSEYYKIFLNYLGLHLESRELKTKTFYNFSNNFCCVDIWCKCIFFICFSVQYNIYTVKIGGFTIYFFFCQGSYFLQFLMPSIRSRRAGQSGSYHLLLHTSCYNQTLPTTLIFHSQTSFYTYCSNFSQRVRTTDLFFLNQLLRTICITLLRLCFTKSM